jgi:molybdenum cofactor sulfurtransferase
MEKEVEIQVSNSLPVSEREKLFLNKYPEYSDTAILDQLRAIDYARLDEQKHVYLDYTGGNLYAESQVAKHHRLLTADILGNPHSGNPSSRLSSQLISEVRSRVLEFFNAGDDYLCVFTQNASGALKIVGECYPFTQDGFLLLSLDNHNSVNGIREFARTKGCAYEYSPLHKESLYLDEEALLINLDTHPGKINKLFAYPAQSNVSGIKHPLEYVKIAKEKGWDVLLDTAAFVPSNKLDLQEVQPDFACISFYKIFGYPTGVGCLLLHKKMFNKLVKPWYAGGTISLSAATYRGHYLMPNQERFEDGTINYLSIPAITFGLDHILNIGLPIITKRVKCLTGWLLEELLAVKHDNGKPVLKIFGTPDMTRRGGTIFMNFYNKDGKEYSSSFVEQDANRHNISLRSGCFCNPGIDETSNEITYQDLERYFTTHEAGNFYDMIDVMGRLRGSIRVSVGLASNFSDIETFVKFVNEYKNH